MPKLKVLSGRELIKIFQGFGFSIKYARGSHFRLARIFLDSSQQVLNIPDHKEIAKGTLMAIYRQALRYIPAEDLRPHFYTE
jgi:predicted RNA binding protein YcfA (HicA-like mRNA interferase family)